MRYRHLIFLITPAALILGGCEIRSETDIYVADLYENADLSTPTTMSVEIPSCSMDNRSEVESSVLSIFSASSDASVVGCRSENMTSLLQVDLSAMISNAPSEHDVTFVRDREGSNAELAVHIHPRFFQRAQNMASEQYTSIDPDDLSISINLHNDTRGSVRYTINEGWVGGEPVMNHTQTMDRRDRARIRFTDVVSEWVFHNQGPMVLRVVNERAGDQESSAPSTSGEDESPSGDEASGPVSLCEAGQEAVFSCPIESKMVSLCSGTQGAAFPAIQYRFGTPGNLEMVLPSAERPSVSIEAARLGRSSLGVDYVEFGIGKHIYAVEQIMPDEGGAVLRWW